MFIARCKYVGFWNIFPLSNLFFSFTRLTMPQHARHLGGTRQRFTPLRQQLQLSPQVSNAPTPHAKAQTFQPMFLYFHPLFFNTAQEEALDGQEKAQFTNHHVLCVVKETWRQAILTFWASHQTLNSDVEPPCECDRLQDNESTVWLPLLLALSHSSTEPKHYPLHHVQNETLKGQKQDLQTCSSLVIN